MPRKKPGGRRCDWAQGDPLYERYHDEEWGVPVFDDRTLFEFLLLEGAQAGVAWITILRKRDGYRRAYRDFDPVKIARFTPKRIDRLLLDPAIVRNRLKVESAVSNARAYLDILDRFDSFADYVWQFVDHRPVQNRFRRRSQVPVTTSRSDAMSRTLKKDGFRFVGSTICYAYMQATGMVNDHLVTCDRHEACRRLAP